MAISITIKEAKYVLGLIAFYQGQRLHRTRRLTEKVKKGKEKFEPQDLEDFEADIVGLVESGHFGDKLEELISDAQASDE